jgi:hypothetical protein
LNIIKKGATLKYSGEPPIDAFMRLYPRVNTEGYEVNLVLINMLHTKKFAGYNDTEDLYAHIMISLKIHVEYLS